MSILIFALIALIIVALLVYAVDLVPIAPPFNNLIRVLIIILAVVLIASRAGLF